ncbi:interleukin-10 receptor subunit beta-like isoform X2 [Cebidichthys violaceus]|uniref:interleukin-10 receptor subunit beta-like isoform X2 n=1 Tax=Cebidichthys violaceus TaxID=271503 RepID=UPI0035C993B6
MSAAVCAFILTFSTTLGPTVVSGVLSAPTNVRLSSNDMNLVLRWDSPERPASSLVYTTEFKSSVYEAAYRVGCVNISNLECDLSCLNISVFHYGTYKGRVQAQSGTESSAWMESNQITLDKDTIISSPDVSLFSNGAAIEVSIKDPVFTISALRKVYHSATYNITYWKHGQREKARSKSNIQQNRVVLSDLDPWTKYCVRVQIITERKPSKPSAAVCESTTNEAAPWVAAVATFGIVATLVALVVVAVVYRKRFSHFLCPEDALPQHFKEYLLAPPNSPMYLAMRNSHPPDEIYNQVSVIADSRTLEEGQPLEAAGRNCSKQPDTT